MSPMLSAGLAVFPANGMDRSLHVAVLIGLVLSTFFTEAFGWTYAGLVVPGYIATVFAASPVTGCVVAVEGIVTYLLVALIGRWVTRTGAWSTAFGRERFYLFIVCGVVVRLAMDGWVLPWLGARYRIERAHELYSLGLVLVPLVANAFWNAGLAQALPRIGFLSLLTYLCLLLLFRYTNLSVSRFQVINDSLSSKFMQEPKAHLILVIGAFLGARNNVRYGWDYNGILVPGLLAVAWYEPTKLATTAAEALTVYFLCVTLTSHPPFSRMLIVGPRRTLLAYFVGFVVKIVGSHVLARVAPGVQLIDYFGFGYLLPALIAVKMWNKDNVGVVLMPTLQVSITAFALGNGLGWALGRALPPEAPISVAPVAVQERASASMALVLGDSTRPLAVQASRSDTRAGDAALDLAVDVLARGAPGDAALAAASAIGVKITRAAGEQPFYVIAPHVDDPDATPPAPRAAVRRSRGADRWMILLEARGVGSALPVLGERVAQAIGADAVVTLSPHGELRTDDLLFAHRLQRLLAPVFVLVLAEEDAAPGRGPVLDLPPRFGALDQGALERAIGRPVEISWRGGEGSEIPFPGAPRVVVPRDVAEEAAAEALGAPAAEAWPGALVPELRERLPALTTIEPPFRPPSIEELRVFDAVLAPVMLAPPEAPSAWHRAIAAQLGYRFVRIGPAAERPRAWALAEIGPSRRGWPTWIARASGAESDLLIEAPAPRWEMGTAGASMAIYESIEARGLLIGGALPDADPLGASDPRRWSGRRSYFQRIHETWIGAGRSAASIQGIAPDRGFTDDAVITYGFEALDRRQSPAWAAPVEGLLGHDLQLEAVIYDGAGERSPFSGSADPAMAYARRFEPGSFAIVYLAGPVRAGFDLLTSRRDERLASALTAAGDDVRTVDVAARAASLADCGSESDARWPERSARGACEMERPSELLATFADLGYPADLAAAREQRGGCWFEVARDEPTGRLFGILARPGEVRLFPFASPLARRAAVEVTGSVAARRVVRAGVSRVVVRRAP